MFSFPIDAAEPWDHGSSAARPNPARNLNDERRTEKSEQATDRKELDRRLDVFDRDFRALDEKRLDEQHFR